MERFGQLTSVTGLHVDPLEEVLYVLLKRAGHAEIEVIDLRDELGLRLRVLRLPDLATDSDHDVVWGALSSWHPKDQRPRLLVVTRTPAKATSFSLCFHFVFTSFSLCFHVLSALFGRNAVAEVFSFDLPQLRCSLCTDPEAHSEALRTLSLRRELQMKARWLLQIDN